MAGITQQSSTHMFCRIGKASGLPHSGGSVPRKKLPCDAAASLLSHSVIGGLGVKHRVAVQLYCLAPAARMQHRGGAKRGAQSVSSMLCMLCKPSPACLQVQRGQPGHVAQAGRQRAHSARAAVATLKRPAAAAAIGGGARCTCVRWWISLRPVAAAQAGLCERLRNQTSGTTRPRRQGEKRSVPAPPPRCAAPLAPPTAPGRGPSSSTSRRPTRRPAPRWSSRGYCWRPAHHSTGVRALRRWDLELSMQCAPAQRLGLAQQQRAAR